MKKLFFILSLCCLVTLLPATNARELSIVEKHNSADKNIYLLVAKHNIIGMIDVSKKANLKELTLPKEKETPTALTEIGWACIFQNINSYKNSSKEFIKNEKVSYTKKQNNIKQATKKINYTRSHLPGLCR